ncbi:MAG: class I SAM-dependent methyltransferase [Rhodoblastus sp.]
MSGFDPGWLDLREPADFRARNPQVLAQCAAYFSGRDHLRIVDLGCGSGSNLRALSPHMPARQSWRLVDHDANLLAAARDRLTRWADQARDGADGALHVSRGGKTVEIEFVEADLALETAGVIAGADLVSAAALFDLVSERWMRDFVEALARARTPFYTALTYNGVEIWSPGDARDAEILKSFHVHQARDKGFGPSAGPRASAVLARLLRAKNYEVAQGDSPWRLARADAALIGALADGVAQAAAETGFVAAERIAAWRAARARAEVEIGHADIFAYPV